MNRSRLYAALVIGLAVFGAACSTSRPPRDRPAPYGVSAIDDALPLGLMARAWAAHRDLGKPARRSFWNDAQYRRATEGYRTHYGSKAAYADGFRAGYERGYRERRLKERNRRRR